MSVAQPVAGRLRQVALTEARNLVDELKAVLPDSATRDEKLGTGQWRTLVQACQEAISADEVEALIAYRTGRDHDKNKGFGQHLDETSDTLVGDVVLNYVDKIKDQVGSSLGTSPSDLDRTILDTLALFFGFVAWHVVAGKPRWKKEDSDRDGGAQGAPQQRQRRGNGMGRRGGGRP